MPTIQQIEQNLLLASSTGNQTLLASTLTSITAEQKPLIMVYSQTLSNLAQLPPNPTLVSSMTRNLMSKVGSYVDAQAIGQAMEIFSQHQNYGALDAVTDYLTVDQKTQIGFTSAVSSTLQNIVYNDAPFTDQDNTLIANTVRDLMWKLGASADAQSIGQAIEIFSQNQNYGALDAVTDYLTANQKTQLGFGPSVSMALNNLAFNDTPFSPEDDALIANTVRDLMRKLGASADAQSIGQAIEIFSQNQNYGALDAVTDYLTANQKTELGFGPSVSIALNNLAFNDIPFTPEDDAAIASVVRDLMWKLGATVDAQAIGQAIEIFSQNQNYGALDAVTDYLTANQKTQLGFGPSVSIALNNLAFNDIPFTPEDDALIANTVRNLMQKLGAAADAQAIGQAIEIFSQNQNYGALDAVTDYLTVDQKTQLGFGPSVSIALNNLAFNDTPFSPEDDALIANTVRDLTSKLGAQVDAYTIQNVVQIFSNNGNVGAVDAVLSELPSSSLTASLLQTVAPYIQNLGATLGTSSSNTYNGSPADDKYLGLAGNDTLYGNDGEDQLYGGSGSDKLYGGHGHDVLHGGNHNDQLYGDSGNDVIYGGKGSDVLYGGTGADTFAFTKLDQGTGIDTIKDFNLAEGDNIDISDVLVQHDQISDAISQFVKLTASGADTLLQIDVDGAAGAHGFSTFAKIENVTGLDLTTLINNGDIIV